MDSTKRESPLSFRPGDRLEEELAARAEPGRGPSSIARRDLERYYESLRRSLTTVALTEAEAMAILDVANGTLYEPHSVPLLWAEVDDACRHEGLAERWGIDGPALVEKLRSLSYAQSLALVDAAERWWRGPYTKPDPPESLREVGLVR